MTPQTMVLLTIFLERQGDWRYGYDLGREAGLKSGTLYPILIRLSQRGWLESEWRHPEGEKPRHMYRLTPHGRRAARLAVAEVRPGLRRLAPAAAER